MGTRRILSSSRLNMANNFWDSFLEGKRVSDTRSSETTTITKQKCPVLICPAQLSVPADYAPMIAALEDRWA